MDTSLPIQELRVIIQRQKRAMPDVGTDVEATGAITPETHKSLRRDIIARQCQRHDKGLPTKGVYELSSIGMVVGTLGEGTLARTGCAF